MSPRRVCRTAIAVSRPPALLVVALLIPRTVVCAASFERRLRSTTAPRRETRGASFRLLGCAGRWFLDEGSVGKRDSIRGLGLDRRRVDLENLHRGDVPFVPAGSVPQRHLGKVFFGRKLDSGHRAEVMDLNDLAHLRVVDDETVRGFRSPRRLRNFFHFVHPYSKTKTVASAYASAPLADKANVTDSAFGAQTELYLWS